MIELRQKLRVVFRKGKVAAVAIEELDGPRVIRWCQYGGGLLRETRLAMPGSPTRVIMAFDPDGMRLEVIQAPGDPNAVPGSPDYHLA